MRSNMFQKSLLGAIALCFVGCAEHSLRVRPEIPAIDEVVTPIACNVIYEQGNLEYLPSLLQFREYMFGSLFLRCQIR